ncbi:MAG: SPOR domain-containing protein [Saprospiraceae bacterium]|nr:SPOR domain-containing protein [Saprospiraceae bacterium]
MKRILLSVLALVGFTMAQAQMLSQPKDNNNIYTIQLGAFEANVKQADFEAIRSYAYVYKRDGQVFVGGFSSEEAAEPILAKIKTKGFDDAFVAARSLKAGKLVYVIQIATKNAGEPIDWKNYSRVGTLYTMPNGGQVRFVHGAYEDKNDANVKLKDIVALGFTDAFVKGVKDVQLNPITDFETGDKTLLPNKDITEVSPRVVPPSYSNVSPKSVNKRKSVIKLQEALKELGLNDVVSDGLYGKQTQLFYDKAVKNNRRLATYSELAQKNTGFEGWEDGRLLLTIAHELSIKDGDKAIVADLFNNLPTEKLSEKETNTALNWHSSLWKKLEAWSTTGQYNDQVYTALKVAYYRTLVHLEDYYASNGIAGEAGTALAVSVIKTLIADDFEGFN